MNRVRRKIGFTAIGLTVAGAALALQVALDRASATPAVRDTVEVFGPVPAAWAQGLQLVDDDPRAALDALRNAEEELAPTPPRALLEASLAAALAAGALREAEWTVEKLAIRGFPERRRDFVVGWTEYVRGRRAKIEAEQPAPDPTALTRGRNHAEAAAAAFQRALLAADGDWPEARRNAERALVLLAEFRRMEEQRDERDSGEEPEPPDPEELESLEQDPRLEERRDRLSAAELQALWQRLAEAEQEKRTLRREAQRARSADVEEDW